MSTSRFKVYEGQNGEWFFNLVAPNNKVILSSEGYNTKFGAYVGVQSVRVHSKFVGRFETFRGKNKEWYFNLKAFNNKIIGRSEGYKRKAGVENGINSVQKNAFTANQETS
jgi:uncharacterized protein YegP (UPF0339 family)